MNFRYNNQKFKKRKLANTELEEEPSMSNFNISTKGNHIYFYEEINKETIMELINQIKDLEEFLLNMKYIYEVEPIIKLHIYSNGGDAYMGLSTYDFIKNMQIPIYTYIDGMIASAATFIYLAGSNRFMTENSTILMHQLSTGFWGKYEDLKDEYKNTSELMRIIKKIYSENTNMKKKEIDDLLKRELLLTYNDAKKYKIIT